MKKVLIVGLLLFLFSSCTNETGNEKITYNIIQPQNGIYAVIKKNVNERETINNFFEKITLNNNEPKIIERYDDKGNLTDELSTPAITKFEYDENNIVHFVKYFDKNNNPAEDKKFGFASIEYIYDKFNQVRMEIYRDSKFEFLKVPKDDSGKIAKIDFLSPVLTYEYLGDSIKIKALDQNFNLLKEVIGDKPCVPFIDCGNSE